MAPPTPSTPCKLAQVSPVSKQNWYPASILCPPIKISDLLSPSWGTSYKECPQPQHSTVPSFLSTAVRFLPTDTPLKPRWQSSPDKVDLGPSSAAVGLKSSVYLISGKHLTLLSPPSLKSSSHSVFRFLMILLCPGLLFLSPRLTPHSRTHGPDSALLVLPLETQTLLWLQLPTLCWWLNNGYPQTYLSSTLESIAAC